MESLWTVQHSWLIPLLPLIGAAVAGLFGAKWLRGQSHWPIWLGVGASAVLSLTLLFQTISLSHEKPEGAKGEETATLSTPKDWFTWAAVGDPKQVENAAHSQQVQNNPAAFFEIKAGTFFDPLSIVMLSVVTGIGFLITVFAAGYMKGEEGYWRFFAYLGLFIFMMTCLVMGNNLIMLYLGWEGVGLCSYLLIGYYFEKPAAREAAKKAFLVNRVGDFGFAIGIMLSFLAFGTVSYFGSGAGTHTGLLEIASGRFGDLSPFQKDLLYWIPFCLMLGAIGKSAQFPLYVWLPDAMEGPTPVSALIHAATMVTAGVYMIARCGPLFVGNVHAMNTVARIGAVTAIFAATIALRQFDLKKVFAYSTVSQLGFMFVGVGVLAPVAGVFHLVTHAFFKALLFLSSGVVMHAMAGELDMRKMSGLKKVLPITYILMGIGCLALAGFPFLSGFFSKDAIVGAAMHRLPVVGIVLLVTAFMTAYYTFRLFFRVFWGPLVVPEPPADAHGHGHDDHSHGAGHHNHEPLIMIAPLVLLAVGAVLAGYVNFPAAKLGQFLGQSPSFAGAYEIAKTNDPATIGEFFGQEKGPTVSRAVEYMWMGISAVIALAGIALAWLLHFKDRALADRIAAKPGMGLVLTILDNKFFIDEIYQSIIVEPLRFIGKIDVFIDRFVVDGLANLAAGIPQAIGFVLKLFVQTGYLQGYAAAMMSGVGLILILVFVAPGYLWLAATFIVLVAILLIFSAVFKLGH